jgi:excisionase family DNA binding protein
VAEQLDVSPRTVTRWVNAGELIAHRFGAQIKISEADLQTFIALGRQPNTHD